jgi:thiopeptide-type bacteriocin biosynthesis protein
VETSAETRWVQVNITFPGQDAYERERRAVGHLSRVLPVAEADGHITSWFFIRKGRWRVRFLPAETGSREAPHDDRRLHSLLTQDLPWTSDIYEPEIHAFGGPASMDTAHTLFHADSRHLLTFLAGAPAGRRERSLILLTAFMRAAGLDVGEQGDVWGRVADQRSALRGDLPAPTTWASFTGDVRRLLLGNARSGGVADGWLTAFQEAGTQLRALREAGRLTRGIRAVTALHVIFHWNRIGIPGSAQAVLAQAAKEAIFGAAP